MPMELRARLSSWRAHSGTRLLAGLAAVLLLAGCAATRAQDRLKVIEAENIDLRQQNDVLADSTRRSQLAQDRALSDLQQQIHERQQAEERAAGGDLAMRALDESRDSTSRLHRDIAALDTKVDRLATRRPAPAMPPAVPTAPPPSPEVDAFAADLRAKLDRFDVKGMPVEVRTMRDGRRRVAVVLQNAFPSGKDTLAYNPDAVRAVVNLGRLIAASYPNSRVVIEGHTDSDPIRKTNWRDNQHLSEARADAVRKLLSGAGVGAERVTVQGMGAGHPLAPGATDRAKARNRRVEIYIEPNA